MTMLIQGISMEMFYPRRPDVRNRNALSSAREKDGRTLWFALNRKTQGMR